MKYFITCFPAVLSAILIIHFAGTDTSYSDTVFNNIKNSGNFEQLDCSLKSNTYLGNYYIEPDKKEEIILSLAKKLNISGNYSIVASDSPGHTYTIFTCNSNNLCAEIKLTTIMQTINEVDVSLSQYIYVQLDFHKIPDNIARYKYTLKSCLQDLGYCNDVFIDFHGIIKGAVDFADTKKLCNSIALKLNGKITDNVVLNNSYSVYGYSDSIDDYIKCDGNKINFNIAFSYDENSDLTEFFLSSPIINSDY